MTEMGTSSDTETPSEIATKYRDQRDHLFTNANELIQRQEFQKASEFLWGAIAASIKATAALTGRTFTKDNEFFDIVKDLGRKWNDPSLYVEFLHVRVLHNNFYDKEIPDDAFPEYYKEAVEFLEKLHKIMIQIAAKAPPPQSPNQTKFPSHRGARK